MSLDLLHFFLLSFCSVYFPHLISFLFRYLRYLLDEEWSLIGGRCAFGFQVRHDSSFSLSFFPTCFCLFCIVLSTTYFKACWDFFENFYWMHSLLFHRDVNVCQIEHVFATVFNFSLADIASDLYHYHIIVLYCWKIIIVVPSEFHKLIHGSFNKHITKNHIKYCDEHYACLDIINLRTIK